MTRYIIENNINDKFFKSFNFDGYVYHKDLSSDKN